MIMWNDVIINQLSILYGRLWGCGVLWVKMESTGNLWKKKNSETLRTGHTSQTKRGKLTEAAGVVGKGGIAAWAGGGMQGKTCGISTSLGICHRSSSAYRIWARVLAWNAVKKRGDGGKSTKRLCAKFYSSELNCKEKRIRGKKTAAQRKSGRQTTPKKTALWLPPVVRLNEITTETGKWKSTLPKCTDQSEWHQGGGEVRGGGGNS